MSEYQGQRLDILQRAEKYSLTVAIAVVVLSGVLSLYDLDQMRRDSRELETGQNLITQVSGLVSAVGDAESGRRGYLLNGKPEDLERYRTSRREVQPRLNTIYASASGSPKDRKAIDRLQALIEAKFAESEKSIEIRRTQGAKAAQAIILAGGGPVLMDRIREGGAETIRDLSKSLAERSAAANRRAGRTVSADIAGSILLLGLLGMAASIIGHGTNRRKELIKAAVAKERETAESRDLLHTILSGISDAVITIDSDKAITFMNPAAEALTGLSLQQALAKPVDEVYRIVDEATLETVESPVQRAVREGATVELQDHTLLLARDGNAKAIDDSAAPLRDSAGTITGAVVTFRDISARKQSERALEESEKRFREAFAAAPIGMVLTDTDGKFIYSNKAYCEIIGYGPSELPETNFLALTHPDEVAHNRDLFQQLVAGSIQSYVIEKRAIPKNGTPFWVRASATILQEGPNKPARVIGIVEDIDARKRAESLLTAKARLDALDAEIGKALTQADTLQASLKLCAEAMVRHLDAAFARIWTMNRGGDTLELQASAGMYTHLNGAHARIPVGAFKIGRIAAECKPHLTNDVAHDERVSDKAWALANGMVGFAGYPLLIGERVVGVIGMFAKQAVPDETLDALGSISDSIAIGIERKRSEADLVAALERERSAKVELETSARALLHSNENLQHFVNAASHDLRSPLRTISLMSALLSKRYGAQLDGKGDELVKAITNGATRMDSLLSDLLSFCTTSHSEKAAEPVSMKEALGEALENLRSAIAESDAVVTTGDLPSVMIHKTHLLQLFQNLIGNAIKYRSEARPQVNISATYRNSEWVVKVRDNGVGFDQKYADEVFGAFKRLHGGEYPGSGIGLATCKRIVDGYGGAIWAESKVGCGSSFFFTLPAELAVSDMPISRAG